MSSIQSLRDCTEICRALIRFSGAKCQRGICYFLRQVSLSINLSLFVLLFGVNVPHAFAQVEYFTFTTQTGTGAGDSFTAVMVYSVLLSAALTMVQLTFPQTMFPCRKIQAQQVL